MVKVLASFPPSLHEDLKAQARAEGIAVTEYLRNVVRDHIAGRPKVEATRPRAEDEKA